MTVADLAGTKPYLPNPYPPEEKALNAALAKAQGEFPAIPKDKTAKAGSYSYDYADLASIRALVAPVLAKHGLSVIQPLENPSGGRPSIRTELRHVDGGRIMSSFPLGEWSTPQQLGSLQTYYRRYAYCAILGIAPQDEDDDGRQGAVAPHSPAASAEAQPPGRGESPFQPPDLLSDVVEDLTSAQRKKIFAIRTKLIDADAFTEEQWKEQLLEDYGVDSVSGLTKEQASNLIDRLLKREEALDDRDH